MNLSKTMDYKRLLDIPVMSVNTIHDNSHSAYLILDTTVISIVTSITSAITWLLAVQSPFGMDEELKLLLLPLIGSLLSSGGMIMLNPKPETRRIVIGRAMFALLFGCLSPQVSSIIFTSTEEFFAHPTILLGSGAVFSMFFYACSRPFTARLYERSQVIADYAEKKVEQTLRVNVMDAVKDEIEKRTK